MLFSTLSFWVFFLATFAAYLAAGRENRRRVLLISSLLFYVVWLPAYLLLLLGELAVTYFALRKMVVSPRPRAWLIASLVVGLGVLAWFKYAAFAIATVNSLLAPAGASLPIPEIVLPLGISFYTFQMIALQVDVYRGTLKLPATFSRYVLFLCFFPQLIAGPILRGAEFLPQLERGGVRSPQRDRRAIWLITIGLAKKVLLADLLLAPFVDAVYADAGFSSAPEHLLAVYSFAFQIYCDFSGYSDIARGLALLLGYELPLNFSEPYLSRDPTEFWRRWHITLSRWLRDYLYVPLGGNRASSFMTNRNLLVTMVLGGLWHGAGWTYLVWGTLHGLWLVAYRPWRGGRAVPRPELLGSAADWLRVVLVFHVVALLWIPFRAVSLGDAWAVLERTLTGSYGGPWPVAQVVVIGLCVVAHLGERWARVHRDRVLGLTESLPGAVGEGAVLGFVLGLVLILGGAGGEFIYFQF
jgi:alginate O-acetyltransferase complex protein AlgI